MRLLRRTTFWLGIILISLSWRMAFRLVTPPAIGPAVLIVLTGFVCVLIGSRGALQDCGSVTGCGGTASLRCLVTAGAVLLVTGISTWALLRVAPSLHDIDIPGWLSPAVECLSTRLGVSDGMLVFWDGAGLHRVRLTYEGLGLYEMWYVVIGLVAANAGMAARLTWAGAARSAAIGVAVFTGFVLVRFAALVAIAVEFGKPRMLWHPAAAISACLPVALLMARVPIPRVGGVRTSLRRMGVFTLALAILAGFALRPASSYDGSMVGVAARVVIDESHSDWEWATIPFDTTSFGIRAEYNYYCFSDYIGQFHEVEVNAAPLTPRIIHDCDILIVKTPTEPYVPSEIDAIVEFVRRGGGLLLIGDHTNLFGMTTHLNRIAERFGMRFRGDDTFDLATGGFSSHVSLGLWTPPLMRGIERFGFLTSCTIEGGPGLEPIMLGCGLGSEDGDYGHPNFFGDISYDLADRFGVFLQAAARRFGRGRVLLFTDSTCFSNFCMFSPGTPEVALRFLAYLKGERDGQVSGRAWAGQRTVLVDTTHSRASFYTYIGPSGRPPCERYEEFYLSLARVGMSPVGGDIGDVARVCQSGPETAPGMQALVVVNPTGAFSRREKGAVEEFVESGGILLVLDSITNSGSTANVLLAAFRMGISMRSLGARGQRGDYIGDGLIPGLEVHGGDPVALDPSGRITASRARYGRGAVIVAVDSCTFSEMGLGRPLQHTHFYSAKRNLYRSLFALLDMVK